MSEIEREYEKLKQRIDRTYVMTWVIFVLAVAEFGLFAIQYVQYR